MALTKKEFIKTAVRRGYCDFAQARDFCKRHPQPEYDESELDRLYIFDNLYPKEIPANYEVFAREWQTEFAPATDSIFRRI